MKRYLKLREAHKVNGSPSVCSVIWDGDGHHLVTAAASDPSISIHEQSQLSKPVSAISYHKSGVTALALCPSSKSLASGSIDHSVKVYSFPDGEFQSNVTRFTLPIRSLAFNKSGSLLAAAGDDDGIKLIATIDSSISRVLKGHRGSVTGLAFDPKNEFLASADGFGTVIIWELSSGTAVHTLKAIAPNYDSDQSLLNVLSWSPDGETLAVPGLRNDVVMYDRDTAEKLFTLKGDHEKTVCFLSWSPNGKYMATSGLDKQVLIWDIDQRQDIERQKFDDRVCCLVWKPNGNALAVIDVMGKFGVWDSAVPSHMKSPTEDAPSLNSNGLLLFDDDDDDDGQKPGSSGSLDDAVEESHGDSFPTSRKRLRKQSHIDGENFDEDIDGEEGLHREIESRKRSSVKRRESVGVKEECVTSTKFSRSKLQEAFQPGSTPVQEGKRRFLVYNMLGSITTIENEAYSHIEVDFHDTGRGPRVPAMTDYFGFTMASLNENGSIFANPCKGEKITSSLMYRPFSSWANNSEWSMRFESEEVKAVALGTGWVAAVTNLNFLRIFTEGGLQRHVISLNGLVVATAGYKDELAIVTHASDCLPTGDQMLEVRLFNIAERTQPITCRLPLTPNASLAWIGFSEEGQLSTYDSKGILRVFSNHFGGNWLPLFSASKARKSEDENYWIVGLNASKLFCIVCNSPELYPSVMPKPVLTLLNLSFPLASSDLGAGDLENELIISNLLLSQTQKKIEDVAAAGLDITKLEDEAFNMEATLDRCILKLIASCCNGDKLVRATELARLLTLEKSVKGAIKLATVLKLPRLAERFNEILEERLLNECSVHTETPKIASKFPPASEIQRTAEPSPTTMSPSTPFPQPHFPKQGKTEEKSATLGTNSCSNIKGEASIVNLGRSPTLTNPFAKTSSNNQKTEDKGKKEKEPAKVTSEQNSKEQVKQIPSKVSGEGNLASGANEKQLSRPTNPFAKSSSNQDRSSLIDSIKKMRKADHERNERVANKKTKA